MYLAKKKKKRFNMDFFIFFFIFFFYCRVTAIEIEREVFQASG